MPTALLICMENSFWNIGRDHGNFVKSFEKSFTLYVESGTRWKVEADIENLGYPFRVTDEYKELYFKIIMEHNLRKFQLFCQCNQHTLFI